MSPTEFQESIIDLKTPLKAFALNLTCDRDDALDLVQETYFRALSNQEKFHEGTNLKAWLLTIMKNIFINNYRKTSKRTTVNDVSDNLYLLNAGIETTGNHAEKEFVLSDLMRAIQQLDEEYRKPFIMHYHGYKYEEIAEEMRLPLGTVKSRIFFARKQMKDFLENKGFDRF